MYLNHIYHYKFEVFIYSHTHRESCPPGTCYGWWAWGHYDRKYAKVSAYVIRVAYWSQLEFLFESDFVPSPSVFSWNWNWSELEIGHGGGFNTGKSASSINRGFYLCFLPKSLLSIYQHSACISSSQKKKRLISLRKFKKKVFLSKIWVI